MIRPATAVCPLPELLESLRAKGVRRGIGPMAGEAAAAASPSTRGAIPTGFAGLDEALRTGGWPRGALALLDAPQGAGATSLAVRSLAAAQQAGGIVAWIDVPGCLDPATVERLGIDLAWLLVVRPASADEALDLAGWLARSGLVDATLLDLGERRQRGAFVEEAALRTSLDRLDRLLVRGRSVMLLRASAWTRDAAGSVASVRVALEREAWLTVGRDIVGQRVRVRVDRQRWALSGGEARLDLWFAEGRRIDPLFASLAEPLQVPDVSVTPEQTEERQFLRVLSA